MKRLALYERIAILIVLAGALVLLGANLGRKEIERRTIEEMKVYVGNNKVYIVHKGETYLHDECVINAPVNTILGEVQDVYLHNDMIVISTNTNIYTYFLE